MPCCAFGILRAMPVENVEVVFAIELYWAFLSEPEALEVVGLSE